MATVDEIRQTIALAMQRKNEGPVEAALDMGLERNHLRDFLEGRKQSLKTEIMLAIAERYSIPFKDLIITKQRVVRRTA